MEQKVLLFNKPVSITPHQLIEKFRSGHPEYKSIKLGYAGRLDPMAEGLMLVLVGEENKQRAKYEVLPKTYEFSVLFGIKTDTYDILGLAQKNAYHAWSIKDGKNLNRFVKNLPGKKLQQYPPYSSRTVDGIPLYKWARDGKLKQIAIPTHTVDISSLKALKTKHIASANLLEDIEERIKPLIGDFRQVEIIERWRGILIPLDAIFTVKSFTLACSSGTYVRSIAHEMGSFVKKEALALEIKRTAIGKYRLEDLNY